jgi:hypothetical protein
MLRKTPYLYKKFVFCDLFPLLIHDCEPTIFQTELSDKTYLEGCQKYVEPSTEKNMLHYIFRDLNYDRYKDMYSDIAKKISTPNNIFHKDISGKTPIHHAYRNKDFDYLNYLLVNDMVTQKIPYDKSIISHIIFSENQKMIKEHTLNFFDENTVKFGNRKKTFGGVSLLKCKLLNDSTENKNSYGFIIDDFIHAIKHNRPNYIHTELLNNKYLEDCQEYIEPMTTESSI